MRGRDPLLDPTSGFLLQAFLILRGLANSGPSLAQIGAPVQPGRAAEIQEEMA
jgi:hypothetical protein